MNNARENILQRLRQQSNMATNTKNIPKVPVYIPNYHWTREQRVEKLSQHLQAVHAQVFRVKKDNWTNTLFDILAQKSVSNLLLDTTGYLGQEIATNNSAVEKLSLKLSDYPVTSTSSKTTSPKTISPKTRLFSQISAGLTSTKGAIAETGSLIVWPTVQEPRLSSLIPPIHIAIVDADKIYNSFAQAMSEQQWAEQMPTNALLISGPSKTADIEQVLAYGVHGPKELIVIIQE